MEQMRKGASRMGTIEKAEKGYGKASKNGRIKVNQGKSRFELCRVDIWRGAVRSMNRRRWLWATLLRLTSSRSGQNIVGRRFTVALVRW